MMLLIICVMIIVFFFLVPRNPQPKDDSIPVTFVDCPPHNWTYRNGLLYCDKCKRTPGNV